MHDTHSTDAEFLRHEPCEKCGSSDAKSIYSDGHAYCFSCTAYFHAAGEGAETPTERAVKKAGNLIPEGDYKPIASRRLTTATLEKFGYMLGNYHGKGVHIAPYYNQQGTLVAQHIRDKDKNFYWLGNTKGLMLFGQRQWRDNGRMLVITEGEIDAMSISQAQNNKFPVVSIPSGVNSARKAITENIEWIESFEKVVFAFDNDAVGQAAAQECAMLLTPGKARIAVFPLKDASDMLVAGRVKEMLDCVWDAHIYRPDGIISGADLLEEVLKPPKEGYATPYPELNAMIHGIRKGELYLFTAGSGIGKSTIVNEIAYHFMQEHGMTIGVIALEESKKRTAERYIGMELNKPIHFDRTGITEDMLRSAFDHVLNTGRFWLYEHFGSTKLDNLLSKIKYMALALNVDFIVLDHISIVVSGLEDTDGDERKTIDRLMTKLRSLIEEVGIGVLAIVHLKRPDKGLSYNEGRQVSLTDLRGSGALEQLSDVVIALERNQQDENESNIATLRVLKDRPIGVTGVCDRLQYCNDTGRLTVHSEFGDAGQAVSDESPKADQKLKTTVKPSAFPFGANVNPNDATLEELDF